jgi:nitrogen fixation protein FixH
MRPADVPAHASPAPAETPPPPRRTPGKWPFIIVGLLLAHVLLMTVAVMIATHDPSFAVTPNYYEQAVNWDKDKAAKLASAQLGWTLRVEAAGRVDPLGRRAATFVLADAAGAPIPAAKLDVLFFHHAHAAEPQALSLTTASDGRAAQLLPMRHAGFYDFRCTAVAGGKTFTATITQFVADDSAPLATARIK